MKLKGVELKSANREMIFIPRGDGEPIVFVAQAVLDMDEFDALCPAPKAKILTMRGGERREETGDPTYKQSLVEYNANRMAWLVLKSLELTDGLVWDTVNLGQPDTWKNYQSELKNAGFSFAEIGRIISGVLSVNCLDEAKVEEARKRFLLGVEMVESEKS